MAGIPDYQAFMTPLLVLASDRQEHSLGEAHEHLAEHFGLSDDDKSELLPSGRQERYKNRIGWARTYLTKAGLLETTRRGHFRLTQRGLEELEAHRDEISTPYLKKFDEFREFQAPNASSPSAAEPTTATGNANVSTDTPEEAIEQSITELNAQLADELLEALQQTSPSYFEHVVVDLLVAMGYGGSRREAGEVVGRSGDEGIDGIIKEDRLGLDAIYVQAKRWQGVVGRAEIQKFVGALQGQRARKGIFMTTSHFTKEARDYATQIETTVILLDGGDIAELMIEHGVGTSTAGTYVIKRLDRDYFLEE